MDAAMFDGWHDYFLLVGSAAAALIGLLFVVVTLTQGSDLSRIERGQKLYLTPIMFHLGGILLLSGVGMSPVAAPLVFGAVSGAVALVGLVAGVRISHGIRHGPVSPTIEFDFVWYGVIPAGVYLLLLAAGAVLALRPSVWGLAAAAACLMAQLLISMHNAWDLVTFLAPRSPQQLDKAAAEKKNRP